MSGAMMAGGITRGSGGGGGGGTLDNQSITTGSDGTVIDQNRRRGFIAATIGSISDGTSNIYAGAAIEIAVWDEGGGGGIDACQFRVNGVVANSGWTSITGAGGRVLNRVDASFSTAGGKSTWTWNNYGGAVNNNPFIGNPILAFD